MKPEIQITDEFDSASGQFTNYDTGDSITQAALDGKKHLDFRTFNISPHVEPITMYWLDQRSIDEMEDDDMSDLEANRFTGLTETWTAGTAGKIGSLNNRYGLTWNVTTGTNVTASAAAPIDLSEFTANDFISIALPSFPAGSVNLGQSSLKFSDGTTTITYLFSNSLTTITAGNSQGRWANTLGSLKPTTVTLTIQATGSATVKVAAIRMLTADWTASKVDINTRTQTLAPSINLDGTIPTGALPQVWRADSPSSSVDPRPYDAKLGAVFNTGSRNNTNSIILYFRGRREDYWTQLDIDGEDTNADGLVDLGYDQGSLDAVKKQPDYGRAVYNPNPQSDLDTFIQDDDITDQSFLDGTPQAWLERVQDNISASWVQAELLWDNSSAKIRVRNTETLDADAYTFNVSLSPNTEYLFSVRVRDDSIQAWIYSINAYGGVGSLVYDTHVVVDDYMFKRRKGRVGWKIDLGDGDAYVSNFRSQELMFGEFVTHPLESFTPVVGGRLIVGASSDKEMYVGAEAWEDALVTIDNSNSRSDDGSIKVEGKGLFGLQSLPIDINDFRHTKVTFDLFCRKGNKVRAALVNELDWFIPLNMPPIAADKWTSVKIVPRAAQLEQTGKYRLVIYSSGNVQNDFLVDNISVRQRMIVWAARSAEADPWGQFEPAWAEFDDLVNTEHGIMFRDRGTKAQVRGQAISQNVTIDKVYFMPKYAELGRFVWNVPERRFYE